MVEYINIISHYSKLFYVLNGEYTHFMATSAIFARVYSQLSITLV